MLLHIPAKSSRLEVGRFHGATPFINAQFVHGCYARPFCEHLGKISRRKASYPRCQLPGSNVNLMAVRVRTDILVVFDSIILQILVLVDPFTFELDFASSMDEHPVHPRPQIHLRPSRIPRLSSNPADFAYCCLACGRVPLHHEQPTLVHV